MGVAEGVPPREEEEEDKQGRALSGDSQEKGTRVGGCVPRGHGGQVWQAPQPLRHRALEWRALGKAPGPTHLRAFWPPDADPVVAASASGTPSRSGVPTGGRRCRLPVKQ